MTYNYKAGVIVPFMQKFYKQMIVVIAGLFIASMAAMSLSANAASTAVDFEQVHILLGILIVKMAGLKLVILMLK